MDTYKKKYDEALERAKSFKTLELRDVAEYIFPELKESEDERIRKELISFLQLPHPQFVGERKQEKWIAWLEKQAKQTPIWNEEDEHRIELLKALCEDKFLESAHNSTMYGEMKITIDWLKSLRPQNRWKPSEEQMKALHDLNLTGNISYAGQGQVLIELYNVLKKLTE